MGALFEDAKPVAAAVTTSGNPASRGDGSFADLTKNAGAHYTAPGGVLSNYQADEVAKRAPSPLAEIDPLDQFTKQVRARLTRSAVGGAAGRSIASLFGGF